MQGLATIVVQHVWQWRQAPRWTNRLLPVLIATFVLVGGITPALYSYGQPHDHLFVGGLPPSDWENHEHVNPLTVLLGPIAPSVGMTDGMTSAAPPAAQALHPSWLSQVVSVYATAGSIVVLTIAGFEVMAPASVPPRTTNQAFLVVPLRVDLAPQLTSRPQTPPPRRFSV